MKQRLHEYIREKQIDMIETIQYQGYNIVSCGNCGGVFIHDMNDEFFPCPHCLMCMDACDCSDLFYKEMKWMEAFTEEGKPICTKEV